MADPNRQTALCIAVGLQDMNDYLRQGAFREAGWLPLPNHLWQSPAGERVQYVSQFSQMQGYAPPVKVYLIPGQEHSRRCQDLLQQARVQRLEVVQL